MSNKVTRLSYSSTSGFAQDDYIVEGEGKDERLCSKCNTIKNVSEFHLRSDTGKPRRICKECAKLACRAYRKQHLLRLNKLARQYHRKYRETLVQRMRRYRAEHREELNDKSKQWYYKNADVVCLKHKIKRRTV